ncbi:MAG: UPF0175 family protein [Candidatus Saliniplasma sp.]
MKSISIDENILDAIKLPKKDRQKMLDIKLALALYKRGVISLGKARKLSGMGKWESIYVLKKSKMDKHHTERELKGDNEFAECRK